ncbi:MAG: hypothetical protein BJ554DRAFT_7383 [Olpidium bornovanus]|uniref:Glycine cleavage system H protein n=1 Tax=Olpidium bornovanus TaxID=278681 RepID=A0A8H7ZWJ6_9FUNG|nr:MAG: hypothetical protein BJ554DRAFT_7383 [Olpidium bornovanus]
MPRMAGSREMGLTRCRLWSSCFPTRVAFTARKYTRDHEWISVEDGIGTVGITDHAQKKLGDAIFVEVPSTEIGSSVERKGTPKSTYAPNRREGAEGIGLVDGA